MKIPDISHSPLLKSLYSHAVEDPSKVALITVDGENISYRGLTAMIERAATLLQNRGLRAGDRIMLSAQKEIDFVYLYLGAHLIGVVNVVVDAKNNAEHLAYISSVTQPDLAIGMDIEGIPSLSYTSLEYPDCISLSSGKELKSSMTADVMFTSGTTGKPKGVKLSHDNIYSSATNINGFIHNTSDDVELLGLPLCHSFGLGRLRCNILAGSTVVLHNGFANLKSVFDAFDHYGVTGFGMVPAVWAYIKRFSGNRIGRFANRIRYIEIGSATMATEDKELLNELFPDTRICMHYGLTEASRAVFMEFHESRDDLATIGRSVSEKVEVAILDETGTELEPLQEGEICIKGNMVTTSYYNESDNAGAFINGYFRTGDWGYKTADGSLYLVARKKELINVGGKKVSPVEIEEALSKAGVGESMCVAVKDPDGILGEVPKVYLVRGSFKGSPDDIKSRLLSMLEAYKLPRFFEVVNAIPKTASGKKKRTL